MNVPRYKENYFVSLLLLSERTQPKVKVAVPKIILNHPYLRYKHNTQSSAMKKLAFAFLLQFMLAVSCEGQNAADTIIARYAKYLMMTEPQRVEEINQLVVWSKSAAIDPNAANHSQLKAQMLVLLHNTRNLALAWSNPTSPIYHDDSVRLNLRTSLQHCVDYILKNISWSLYQMDVAQDIRDIVILLYGQITDNQQTQCIDILRQHKLQGKGVGTAMMVTNELGIHYGALTKDTTLIAQCRQLIVNDVHVSQAEGIQPDFSFHHDGKRLDMFHSGRSFLIDHLRVAFELKNTAWEFPTDKVNVLTDVILQGWQWMARGVNTVPGAIDRYTSYENALKSGDIRQVIPILKALAPEMTKKFTSLENWQNGKESHTGMHYWPYADFTAYHHPDFSIFIKTISDRTLPSGSDNKENLKGNLLNTGDTYIVHDGMEYFNLMPVWNWQMIPGITSFPRGRIIERQSLVGNANNEKSGAVAMALQLKDSTGKQHLWAQKFWAIHDGMMVCLIGNVHGTIAGHAVTTMDQCRWRGDVTVNKPGNILKAGIHKMDNVRWIHHAGFVYMTMPFWKTSMTIELKNTTGNWRSINSTQVDKTVTENIFLTSIDYGHLVEGYGGYVVAHASSVKNAQLIASQPGWEIFRNSKDCQFVYFKDGTMMAAFYTTLPMKNVKIDMEVSEPCIVLIENNKLYVTDLTFTGKKIRIRWNHLIFNVTTLPNGATTNAQSETE
jgi:chondroitin AC lyase